MKRQQSISFFWWKWEYPQNLEYFRANATANNGEDGELRTSWQFSSLQNLVFWLLLHFWSFSCHFTEECGSTKLITKQMQTLNNLYFCPYSFQRELSLPAISATKCVWPRRRVRLQLLDFWTALLLISDDGRTVGILSQKSFVKHLATSQMLL